MADGFKAPVLYRDLARYYVFDHLINAHGALSRGAWREHHIVGFDPSPLQDLVRAYREV